MRGASRKNRGAAFEFSPRESPFLASDRFLHSKLVLYPSLLYYVFCFFLRERLLKEPLEGATKQQKELQQTKTMLKNPLSPSVVGSGLPVSGFTLQRAAADASSHQSLASALDVPCTPQIAVFVPKATRHSRGSRLARSLVASSLLRRKVKRRVYSRAGVGSKRSAFLFVRFSGIEEPSFQGVQKGSVKKMHAHKTP